jgi:hypothetical protein
LLKLRGRVIMKKRIATREEHCRFFDRLAELIVKPPLLNIPGVHHVIHRTCIGKQEMSKLPVLSS